MSHRANSRVLFYITVQINQSFNSGIIYSIFCSIILKQLDSKLQYVNLLRYPQMSKVNCKHWFGNIHHSAKQTKCLGLFLGMSSIVNFPKIFICGRGQESYSYLFSQREVSQAQNISFCFESSKGVTAEGHVFKTRSTHRVCPSPSTLSLVPSIAQMSLNLDLIFSQNPTCWKAQFQITGFC